MAPNLRLGKCVQDPDVLETINSDVPVHTRPYTRQENYSKDMLQGQMLNSVYKPLKHVTITQITLNQIYNTEGVNININV